jgi:tetratricopeptide (TPR) repeat protein
MKQPETPGQILAVHKLLRSDPQQYLQIVNKWIDQNPKNAHAYFDRHFAWMHMGEPLRALDDLNKAIELGGETEPMSFLSRGQVYRHLGKYEKALEDYNRGEAINPTQWREDAFGPFFQADTYARLGNEAAALERCACLPNDFWTPGLNGAPGGGKAQIADKLRRIAGEARRKRM